jgi:hypothetical protein
MKNYWIFIAVCCLIIFVIRGIEQLKHILEPEIEVVCDDFSLLKGYGYTTEDVEVMSTPWYFDYQDPILLDSRWNFDIKKIRNKVKNNKVVGELPALTEIEVLETHASGYSRSESVRIKSLDPNNKIEGYISNNSRISCMVNYNGRDIHDAAKVKEIINRNKMNP